MDMCRAQAGAAAAKRVALCDQMRRAEIARAKIDMAYAPPLKAGKLGVETLIGAILAACGPLIGTPKYDRCVIWQEDLYLLKQTDNAANEVTPCLKWMVVPNCRKEPEDDEAMERYKQQRANDQ